MLELQIIATNVVAQINALFMSSSPMDDRPIRHETLPEELLEEIRAIHDVLGDYLCMTLDEFQAGFQKDESPGTEIGLWLGITAVWIAYHEEYLNDEVMAPVDERRLLSALIAISSGIEDPAQLGVPREIGQRLLECYAAVEENCEVDADDEHDAE